MASLLGRILSPQSHWTQADLYDAVFTLRIILAGGLGLIFGLGSIEGLYAFLTFLGLNFMVPNSWFTYQGVDPAKYEDEKQPLTMEGFGQALSFFLLMWVASYSCIREA